MGRLYKNQIQTSSAERDEKMRTLKIEGTRMEIVEKVCPACLGRRAPCRTCDGSGIIYRWVKK